MSKTIPATSDAAWVRDKGAVSSLLTLSLRHLPAESVENLRDSACAYLNADRNDDNGCMLVWADRLFEEDDSTVKRLATIASDLGCGYVFFDPDAEPLEGLAVFTHEDEEPWDGGVGMGCAIERAFGDGNDVGG
jgi:hypothetical protein